MLVELLRMLCMVRGKIHKAKLEGNSEPALLLRHYNFTKIDLFAFIDDYKHFNPYLPLLQLKHLIRIFLPCDSL